MSRAFIFVMDSFGIGAAPDAGRFGDEGSDTLGHAALADVAGGTEEVLQSLDLVRYLDPEKVAEYVELLGIRPLASLAGWWLEQRRSALGVPENALDRLHALCPRSKHYALGAKPGD